MKDMNALLAGFGGQGILFMGKVIAYAGLTDGKEVSWLPSYGPEMRGGTANCYVVISDDEIGAPVSNSVDDLIVMNGPSLHKFLPNLKPGGTLFINSSIVKDPIDRDDIKVISVPVTEMALEMGNPRILNIIMLGAYIGYTNAVPKDVVTAGIHHKFENKPKVIPINDKAFETGIEIGQSQN